MRIEMPLPNIFYLFIVVISLAYAPKASADEESTNTSAQEVALAEDYASKAFNSYQNKDYATAVSLYLKAYEIVSSADILYNIAKIYDVGLRDRPLAINFYRRYILDPGAVSERVKTANERLAQLRAAEEASLESFPKRNKNEPDVQPTEDKPKQSQSSAVKTEKETPSDSWSTTRVLGLATGIVGLVALGVGAGFGIAAMSDAEITQKECDGNLCESQEAVDAAKSGNTKADISTVAVSLGGGLVAAGVLLWFLGSNDSEKQKDGSLTMSWKPSAKDTQLGLSAVGRW